MSEDIKVKALKIDVGEDGKEFIVNRVLDILNTDYGWTNGKNVKELEEEFCKITGARYASAVSSGSSAIEIALYALNMDSDCIAFVPTMTAPPTVYSCLHAGVKVVLVDCNESDLGLNVEDLKDKIKRYKNQSSKSVIIPVHVGGIISENIDQIINIANENNMYVIEDCAHAHGATYKHIHAGRRGVIGTFSYFLTKVISSGEGGMVITDDEELDRKIKIIRNYGKENGKHVYKGSSWRMNEFTAAVALWQTKNLEKIVQGRSEVAKLYNKLLKGNDKLTALEINQDTRSSYYKYIVMIPSTVDRENLKKQLLDQYGIIMAGEVYQYPCHKEPVFQNDKRILNIDDKFLHSEKVADSQICLPIYPEMETEKVEYVINCINKLI